MLRAVLLSVSTLGMTLLTIHDASSQSSEFMSDVQRSALHDFRVIPAVEGLESPWSINWLPNGDMLITEKAGRLRIARNGELLQAAVTGVPEVFAQGQGGLFDVLPHPDFAANQFVYLSFAKPLADGASATAVIRARLINNTLTDVHEIFLSDHRGANHYGGRMAFDSEGFLFLTLGDRQTPPSGDLETHPAQDVSNQHGVIVRLNDDGSIPADNPLADQPGANKAIYSYGHRSPQGLAIHPDTGVIWGTEHGPQGGDELNIIKPATNYGWPVVGRGVNYGFGAPIHPTITRRDMENPIHFWVPSIATSGLMIYTGARFPQWYGNIFSGGLAGMQLARLTLNQDGTRVSTEETLLPGIGRIRDVRQGPDGYIYLAIEDMNRNPTSIVRLEPAD